MTAVQRDPRFPASVYSTGSEPAPEASLANRANMLAWLRTGVVLVTAAVVIAAAKVPAEAVLRGIAAALLLVAGLYSALQSWTGWVAAERAIRRGRPLPGARAAFIVAVLVLVAILLVVAGTVPALVQ